MTVVFERLRNDVAKDVDTWKRLPDRQGQIVFDPQDSYFAVVKNGRPDAPRVTFSLGRNEIEVNSHGYGKTSSFTATLTLNRDRQCRLVVDGEELERWQLRQKALAPLFFPEEGTP